MLATKRANNNFKMMFSAEIQGLREKGIDILRRNWVFKTDYLRIKYLSKGWSSNFKEACIFYRMRALLKFQEEYLEEGKEYKIDK